MTRRWVSDPWEAWDEARNPALRRTREVLRRSAASEAEEPRHRAAAPPPSAPEPTVARDPAAERRAAILDLIARVRAGDVSSVDALRRAVDT
jgi:hypothetical protein